MTPQESLPKPIHIGRLIEQRLDAMGMTKATFGRRINTSRQNVNPIAIGSLLRKQSMDTGLLQRIGEALDHNFFNNYADAHVPDSARRGEQSTKVLAAGLDVQTAIARLNVLLLGGS